MRKPPTACVGVGAGTAVASWCPPRNANAANTAAPAVARPSAEWSEGVAERSIAASSADRAAAAPPDQGTSPRLKQDAGGADPERMRRPRRARLLPLLVAAPLVG